MAMPLKTGEKGAVPLRRALISVSDKTGLVEFAKALIQRGVQILSTGGTKELLSKAGISVQEVAEITEWPEMMGGRVKTLHPKIHGGLLARRSDPQDRAALEHYAIPMIDLLVCTLYPFEEKLLSDAPYEVLVETIDIGGPALIRAAAKNHADVTVLVDLNDGQRLLEELEHNSGSTGFAFRQEMAAKAFGRVAAYDSCIAQALSRAANLITPPYQAVGGRLHSILRYGENPHQKAALYAIPSSAAPGVVSATLHQGKPLSYTNILDADAAFSLVAEMPAETAAAVIVKHANACGAALGDSLCTAYRKALSCDPVSAFGGILAFNRPLDAETAEELTQTFTELVIAPEATGEACSILSRKPNLRLLTTGGQMPNPSVPAFLLRSVTGGFLYQERDRLLFEEKECTVVTQRAPTPSEMQDLQFAFLVAKHVASNAVVYAKDCATVGIGAGQMSRVDSVRIAAQKAKDAAKAQGLSEPLTRGSVLASDAFFPFPDGLMQAIEAGATAVIQPGGAQRDAEVIAAADAAGIAMVFTKIRHFRH